MLTSLHLAIPRIQPIRKNIDFFKSLFFQIQSRIGYALPTTIFIEENSLVLAKCTNTILELLRWNIAST